MKKTLFVVLLIGLLTASIPLQGHHRFEFIDVSSEYSVYPGVEFVRTRNLMLGYNDGTFRPFQNITRAELVSVLVKAAGFKPDPNVFQYCFEDVLQQWFANEVCFAKAQGWVSGAQVFYGPHQAASRNEANQLFQNIFGVTHGFISAYVTRGETAQALFNVLGSGFAAGYSAKVATAATVVSPTYYNNPPTVMMNLEWGRLTGFNQTTVDFSGFGTRDPDGDNLAYVWDMGDGTRYFTLDPPAHTYRQFGNYLVTFRVIDSRGASAKVEQLVSVLRMPPAVTQVSYALPVTPAGYHYAVVSYAAPRFTRNTYSVNVPAGYPAPWVP